MIIIRRGDVIEDEDTLTDEYYAGHYYSKSDKIAILQPMYVVWINRVRLPILLVVS